MRQSLLAALVLACLPALADAQQQTGEKLVVAKCGDTGCACTLSDFDAETVRFLHGPGTPEDAVKGTYVVRGSEAYLSPLPPDDVHRAAGGKGHCPMALFEPVVPRDGLWTGSVRVQSVEGCRPEVAAMVPALAGAMTTTVQIDWDGRFDPRKFASGGAPEAIAWTEMAPGSFNGRLKTPGTGALSVTGGLTAKLTTPTSAAASLRLRLAATGGNSAIMQLAGMADCRTFAVYDFSWVRD